jgi:hypothetical protein
LRKRGDDFDAVDHPARLHVFGLQSGATMGRRGRDIEFVDLLFFAERKALAGLFSYLRR